MDVVPNVWEEERLIESFDVDILGRLRPQTLFSFLLNSAWNHTRGTNYGYDALTEKNLIWVLIKVQMLIKRLPKWGELIKIATWGKETVRFYAFRDFIVTSGEEKLISATSSWMILDKTSGRPQRLDKQPDGFPWQPGKDEIKTNPEKIQELKNGRELAGFKVHFSDIDMNRHVNSAKYLEWIMDSHTYGQLETAETSEIELNFLSEALPGDEIAVFSEGNNEHELCSVRRAGDGKELCRARFEWNTIGDQRYGRSD